jgi:RimJ/RimL family protein N-acetyltransferase
MPLKRENIKRILQWNDGQSADFLQQWAGRGYTYPLTTEQVERKLRCGDRIYEADFNGNIIGSIEIMEIVQETNIAQIGRYILNPKETGKGHGTEILRVFSRYCFENLGLTGLRLSVFDFNKNACRCYEKAGFIKDGETKRPNGWIAIEMKLLPQFL